MYSIIMLCMIFVVFIYFIFFFFFFKGVLDFESVSSYECGFDSKSYTRMTFSYRFFLISILFMIFDVEISVMLPIPFFLINFLSFWIFWGFIMILIVGLFYEYYYGSLDWL